MLVYQRVYCVHILYMTWQIVYSLYTYIYIYMYTYIVIVPIGVFFGKKDNATPNECIIISCFFLHPLACSRRNQPFLDLNGGICIYIYTHTSYTYIYTYVIYILCLWICLTGYQDRPMGHYVSPSEGDKPVQVMKFGGISRWKNRAKQICCGIDCKVSFIIQTHIYTYIYIWLHTHIYIYIYNLQSQPTHLLGFEKTSPTQKILLAMKKLRGKSHRWTLSWTSGIKRDRP